MARGFAVSGATAEEAQRSLRAEYPMLTVVSTKRIEMATVQEHTYGNGGNDWWVVVVEGAALPDQDDPEGETEAKFLEQMRGAMRKAHGE